MNHVISVTINGKEFPCLFSMRVFENILFRYESLEKCIEVLSLVNSEGRPEENIFILSLLLNAGAEYLKSLTGYADTPPTQEELKTLVLYADFELLPEIIIKAIKTAQETEMQITRKKDVKAKNSGKLCFAWCEFMRCQIGLTKAEYYILPFGSFFDLISCMAVYNGAADEDSRPIDEIMIPYD